MLHNNHLQSHYVTSSRRPRRVTPRVKREWEADPNSKCERKFEYVSIRQLASIITIARIHSRTREE